MLEERRWKSCLYFQDMSPIMLGKPNYRRIPYLWLQLTVDQWGQPLTLSFTYTSRVKERCALLTSGGSYEPHWGCMWPIKASEWQLQKKIVFFFFYSNSYCIWGCAWPVKFRISSRGEDMQPLVPTQCQPAFHCCGSPSVLASLDLGCKKFD